MPDYVITDPEQVRAWDEQTIEEQGITSIALMERAANAFCAYFLERYPVNDYGIVDVLCGPGNNGGDGAAIARILERSGYVTHVWAWWGSADDRSGDLMANWERLLEMDHPRRHDNEAYVQTEGVKVIVDALFGVGLKRPLEAAFARTIKTANDLGSPATRVAVDVPSGQKVDGSAPGWLCFDAHKTITFAAVKQAALLKQTGPAWGSIMRCDIDLAQNPTWVRKGTPRILSRYQAISCAGDAFAPRERFTHKGHYGHVLVVAGCRGHAGAALLSGAGALNAGAGLVTFYVPERLEQTMQLGLPEAMCQVDPHADRLTVCPPLDHYSSVVIGPGIGRHPDTAKMLSEVFDRIGDTPCVFDADALNLVAADRLLANKWPARAILTPHPGEFARLTGPSDSGYEQLQSLRAYAKTLPPRATVVLKGQYTAIATPDGELYLNFFDGNPGMATGGMGDVLSGIISAIAARLNREDDVEVDWVTRGAAMLGVMAHAKSGDLVKATHGEDGVTAMRVAQQVGSALQAVYEEE